MKRAMSRSLKTIWMGFGMIEYTVCYLIMSVLIVWIGVLIVDVRV